MPLEKFSLQNLTQHHDTSTNSKDTIRTSFDNEAAAMSTSCYVTTASVISMRLLGSITSCCCCDNAFRSRSGAGRLALLTNVMTDAHYLWNWVGCLCAILVCSGSSSLRAGGGAGLRADHLQPRLDRRQASGPAACPRLRPVYQAMSPLRTRIEASHDVGAGQQASQRAGQAAALRRGVAATSLHFIGR